MRLTRRRYLALKVESEQPLDKKKVMNAVWSMLYQLFGEVGASQTGLFLIDWNDEEEVLVVRCSHKALDMMRAVVAAITAVDGKRAVLRTIGVSGTLRGLRRKLCKPQFPGDRQRAI